MPSRIHIPKPGAIGSIIDRNPAWCGRKHGPGVQMTVFEHLATCQRCISANRLYVEETEHRRTQDRLQRGRDREAGHAE